MSINANALLAVGASPLMSFCPEEMEEIGYEEYVYGDGVSLIEWADLINDILPDRYTRIEITKDLDKGFDYRNIKITEVG